MKIKSIKILTILMAISLIVLSIFSSSAAELLNSSAKVEFSVTCDKPGYTFTVYKVADLVSTSTTTYETKYNVLVPAISNAVKAGNSSTILSTLDSLSTIPNTAQIIGTYNSNSSDTATFTNLDQGIYYVKATNFPAGVKSVTNSVFSLPYYDGTNWVYSISNIELATKVTDATATTEKKITNSTKGNVNYTDVSLGETVNFEIRSTTAGSSSMKLSDYTIYDDMSAGLTINKNSFNVSLLKADGTKITDLNSSDFVVTYTSEAEGSNTTFDVSLTSDYLQQNDFYASDVYYTSVTYSATLNKYAVVGVNGNPNTETKLEYTNKNGVTANVNGNTVYVYTYAAKTIKLDEETKAALAGADFAIYATEANAKAQTNALGTGTSDSDGVVIYKNANNEELRLASGTYYIVETKAPTGYMPNANVIEIDVNATYGATFINNTYVVSSPVDGYGTVDVTNHKFVLPVTGGTGTIIFTVVAVVGVAISSIGIVIYNVLKKKAKTN